MSGLVRKFFKGKKTKKEERDFDGFSFGPSTSSACRDTYQFASDIPKISPKTQESCHDESFVQPYSKRRRASPDFSFPSEDSMIEYTQYTLQKWAQGEERRQERRKRKKAANRAEQENYVQSAMENVKIGPPTVAEVEKLRKERDDYKKELEKYKNKCEMLEKKCEQLEMQRRNFARFPPFPNVNNYFFNPPQFPSFQPPPPSQWNFSGGSNFPTPFSTNPSFDMPGSAGPSGPLAPRYADPVNSSTFFDDDDDEGSTSLSDLSNSSKSDESDLRN